MREREPELTDHHEDVSRLAVAVGRELEFDAEEIDVLRRAAEFHDIGKIAIPDEILNKPGPLDEAEWELMRKHTLVGERIIGTFPSMAPVARLVRSSHERWDGKGYPDGRGGDEIPLGARVITVCDAFDAMRSERPYTTRRDGKRARRARGGAAPSSIPTWSRSSASVVARDDERRDDQRAGRGAVTAPAG